MSHSKYPNYLPVLFVYLKQKFKSNLQLITEYDDRIPEIILGDSVRLHQILINLLSNAIKFTSEGNITINVNVKSSTKQKITIEFKVSHWNSCYKIDTIFENFEQAHSYFS
jgi:signal transduction histidine kinase